MDQHLIDEFINEKNKFLIFEKQDYYRTILQKDKK